jgi:hypothetical protein
MVFAIVFGFSDGCVLIKLCIYHNRVIFLGASQTENQTEIKSLYNILNAIKEVKVMPTLKHLLEELEELDIDPKKVRLPGQLYDSLIEDAEAEGEEEQEN